MFGSRIADGKIKSDVSPGEIEANWDQSKTKPPSVVGSTQELKD